MCEFCHQMPIEQGIDNSHQTFGFFSAAAIEEAVRQANNEKDESEDVDGVAGGGKDDDSDGT